MTRTPDDPGRKKADFIDKDVGQTTVRVRHDGERPVQWRGYCIFIFKDPRSASREVRLLPDTCSHDGHGRPNIYRSSMLIGQGRPNTYGLPVVIVLYWTISGDRSTTGKDHARSYGTMIYCRSRFWGLRPGLHVQSLRRH